MSDADRPAPPQTDFLFYATGDGKTNVRVLLDDGTCWMPQRSIAELFAVSKQNVSLHLENVYAEGELDRVATVKQYLTVQVEGSREVSRMIEHFNLDAILAVGYRVRGDRGTQFRRWATEVLGEYLRKGFALDDERLKAAEQHFGQDYFNELLERVRDIRASERRFYQKITDIFATAVDYDSGATISREFFARVQNKMHFATHGRTAAEVIVERVDADKPNVGLTTWKNAPDGPVRLGDVTVAKNYLDEREMRDMNRIVTMYLDYAEDQARNGVTMTMTQWAERLDAFLQFNGREVLDNAGSVAKAVADELAREQFQIHSRRGLATPQPPTDLRSISRRAEKKDP